jgi:hypothetical protein
MLTARILPMPQLDPQRYVALHLSNPLLLAAHPDRMRATAEQWENGGYDANGTAALAVKLYELRKHILLRTAVEPRDNEAEQALFGLAAHPLLKAERTRLREKIMEARPSEYGWLRGLLETAIVELAGQRDTNLVAAETLPTEPAARPLDVALAAIRGIGGRVLVGGKLVA